MKTDIAIVGAGPAGLAAADVLASRGLDVTLLDEQHAAGGQILRQPPASFRVARWLPEAVYRKGKALFADVRERSGLHWKFGTTVLGIAEDRSDAWGTASPSYSLSMAAGDRVEEIRARQVLIAPGCYDMPVSFPGSTRPGVMSAGGIQAFVKSQQLVAGERFVFIGTHPLQLVVADQVRRAGGDVAEVTFAQSLSRFLEAGASFDMLSHGGKLAYFGATVARLRGAGVRIRFGETVIGTRGESAVTSVTVARTNEAGDIDRSAQREIECDRLGVCFGFLASSELARQAGVTSRWSDDGGGWICEHDAWMGTNRPGIFVAGEITGVAGSDAAMQAGQLAALGLLRERGVLRAEEAEQKAQPVRRRLQRHWIFAQRLREMAYPGWRLLEQMLTGDSLVCKCEEVTSDAFAAFLAQNTAVRSASAAKLGCRTGMGLCQGRYCNYYVTRILAGKTGLAPGEIGPFTAQWPAKPVRIGSL